MDTAWGDDDEDDIDDDWDWDTELGLLDPGPEPFRGPYPPRTPYVRPPAPPPDLHLVLLSPYSVGEFLRACRAYAGLSQRGLASAAGVSDSTVARIESGHAADVGLTTLCRLTEVCGVALAGRTGDGDELLQTDVGQRHRDLAGRMLPAHLFNDRVLREHGDWWGRRPLHPRPCAAQAVVPPPPPVPRPSPARRP